MNARATIKEYGVVFTVNVKPLREYKNLLSGKTTVAKYEFLQKQLAGIKPGDATYLSKLGHVMVVGLAMLDESEMCV